MTVLSASHINKYFYEPEKFQVLQEVNFEVKKGEFLSIIGKSGCGKSTLLYILSTMDTDYEGSLEVNGQRLTGLPQDTLAAFRNEHLGFVFQFHFLLPEFTVLQNVMLPALKLGKYSNKEIEERAYEKLRLVNIARALINDPTIIMGDEPTGNLDKANSGLVFDIFRRIAHENGQTIITVTHDPDFANGSDRIIEMSDGRIIRH